MGDLNAMGDGSFAGMQWPALALTKGVRRGKILTGVVLGGYGGGG